MNRTGVQPDITMSVSTAILSILSLSAASERYIDFLRRKTRPWEGVVLLVGGLCLLIPNIVTDFIGLCALGAVMGLGLLAKPVRNSAHEFERIAE